MEQLFSSLEAIKDDSYIIASYYIELESDKSIMETANKIAIGQTLGTWVAVPGITESMRKRHVGRVVNIYDVPSYELATQIDNSLKSQKYIIQIAFPIINFGDSIAMLLTTVMGNDASTSAQVKLIDLYFPEDYFSEMSGPKFGIKGIRELLKVENRPLVLNMIKPCLGFDAIEGAKLLYQTALSGVDIIKDDELLGNQIFCPLEKRVKEYLKAAHAAFEETGKKVLYIPNITDSNENILYNAEKAVELGAEALMVNFAAAGYGTLRQLSRKVNVPILGHYAGAGMFYEGMNNGMSSPLVVGKLPRIAGADMVMINTPYGGYPLLEHKYFLTAKELTSELYDVRPTMPAVGGGVHPGMIQKLFTQLGKDIVLAAGGAVQGHPDGVISGGKAMMQAVEAAINKQPIIEYAQEYKELKTAIDKWGILE